jgi:hypothetical protein
VILLIGVDLAFSSLTVSNRIIDCDTTYVSKYRNALLALQTVNPNIQLKLWHSENLHDTMIFTYFNIRPLISSFFIGN